MQNQIVTRDEWIAARKELLTKEKELTRLRDELSKKRRQLPWVKLSKEYRFEGPNGEESLSDLFNGKSQLLVYHFMFGPDWDEGCVSCSFWADNYNGVDIHLAHRDVSLVAISRAPLDKLKAYKGRMGWTFKWVSSLNSDFNYDYQVSFTPEMLEQGATYNYRAQNFGGEEAPGISVFYKNADGELFHTYSTFSRGLDMMNGAYHYLDLMPKGRDEDELPWSMAWLQRHDAYGD